MKTIKTTIATTLPDAVKAKFTKEALEGMRDQINSGEFKVYDSGWNEIGEVKKAAIPIDTKNLEVVMKLNESLIDKSFEWFFVPYGHPVDVKIEGEIEEINRADLKCIRMVKMPTDLSLKPVRFEMEFVEGVDYFVKKYDELTSESVTEFIEKGNQVAVYYPESMGWPDIIKDSFERGLVVDNGGESGPDFVHPFSISAVKMTFEQFKKQIALSWANLALQKKTDPLLKNIG